MPPVESKGYSKTFNAFVNFASANGGASIANVARNVNTGKRLIVKSATDQAGFIGSMNRTMGEMSANDFTRAAFVRSVLDMFGGIDNVPKSVVKALKLNDLTGGHPLTARRILAVKRAIDTCGPRLESLTQAGLAKAQGLGFTKAELPKVARAANLYALETGCSEDAALAALADPKSKAGRMYTYGGRFLESQANFHEGMRLIDSFEAWHKSLCDSRGDILAANPDPALLDTPTKLNIHGLGIDERERLGLERLVFEEIASDPKCSLTETDPEKVFGMKNNAAMRFFGRNYHQSCLNTVVSMPQEHRKVLFAAFDAFFPLEKTRAGAERNVEALGKDVLIARVCRNIDALAELHARRRLTARNIIKTCYPDMPDECRGAYDRRSLNDFQRYLIDTNMTNPKRCSLVLFSMNKSGMTLDEVNEALDEKREIPTFHYHNAIAVPLNGLVGVDSARKQFGVDIVRADGFRDTAEKKWLIEEKKGTWSFSFPDGTSMTSAVGSTAQDVGAIADKVEALCGKAHSRQASSVLFGMTQSALASMKPALDAFGIASKEHSPINFRLERDANTGAVTIHYSTPDSLPVKIAWSATVDVDGRMTTTKPVEVKKFNADIARNIATNKLFVLPEKFIDATYDIVDEMRQRFGEAVVPENAKIDALYPMNVFGLHFTPLAQQATADGKQVSVEEFRSLYHEKAQTGAIGIFVMHRLEELAKEMGVPDPSASSGKGFVRRNPAIAAELAEARTERQARAILMKHDAELRRAITLETQMNAFADSARDLAAGRIAQARGISVDEAKAMFSFAKLDARITSAISDLLSGAKPGLDQPGFDVASALGGIVDRTVNTYLSKMSVVDGLAGVSDAMKEVLRREVASSGEAEAIAADKVQVAAASMDGGKLLSALTAPNMTPAQRAQAIADCARDVFKALDAQYKGSFGDDEIMPILRIAVYMMADKTPGLMDAVNQLRASGEGGLADQIQAEVYQMQGDAAHDTFRFFVALSRSA